MFAWSLAVWSLFLIAAISVLFLFMGIRKTRGTQSPTSHLNTATDPASAANRSAHFTAIVTPGVLKMPAHN